MTKPTTERCGQCDGCGYESGDLKGCTRCDGLGEVPYEVAAHIRKIAEDNLKKIKPENAVIISGI